MKQILAGMTQSLIFILVSVWVLLSLLLYLFQDRFVYYPYSTIQITPGDTGLYYEEVYLATSDDLKIHGWFLPKDNARGTLLFLHGNAGNISHRLESLRLFHGMDLSVFIIDYRGYGLSEGSPSEEGTYRDSEAAWHYLTKERAIPPGQIVIFGRSLGGAVAAWLATQHTPAALILESTFSSAIDMGKHFYPFLPMKLITRIKYPTIEKMPDIHCPVLIIHSSEDEIVPFQQGRHIYNAANEPRSFLEIQGDHNHGFMQSGIIYSNGVQNFLDTYLPRSINHDPAGPD